MAKYFGVNYDRQFRRENHDSNAVPGGGIRTCLVLDVRMPCLDGLELQSLFANAN
jgi:FixJ family two-component response regulator